MRLKYILCAAMGLSLLGAVTPVDAPTLEPGRYAITYRLELPHLERYGVERTAEYCVEADSLEPLPVLGAKSAFDGCSRSTVTRDGATLGYQLTCKGPAGARAQAVHRVSADGFRGRIAIVLGAKNMTMVEVQSGTRVGNCP